MPVYRRRRKVNPNDSEVRIDFIDESGDAYEEYVVFHHKFITWMQTNGYEYDLIILKKKLTNWCRNLLIIKLHQMM